MVHKLELDREKNSVVHLTQAKADCEGITFLYFYRIPLVTPDLKSKSEL